MQGQSGLLGAGAPKILATSGRGHNPDEIAEMALARLIGVADTAAAPIRDQAHAFREQIRPLLVRYLGMAIRSDRTTLYNHLTAAGQHAAAELVRTLPV